MTKRAVSRECSLEAIKEVDEISSDGSLCDEHFETPRTSVSTLCDDDFVSVIGVDDPFQETEVQESGTTRPQVPQDPFHPKIERLNDAFEPDDEEIVSVPGQLRRAHRGGHRAEMAGEMEERKTRWKPILLVSFINYLIFLPAYTLAVVNFNYLIAIDRSAPVDYNGWMRALMRFGHAIGSAVFAVHCYTTKTYHTSLAVGRLLSIGSCLLYGFIEIFPEDQRRWPWLLIFLVQDMAEASNIIFRSYISRMSTHADRQTACSLLAAGEMIAIVSGPGIQALAGLIEHDIIIFEGIEWLKLNKYTAPIWICFIISIVTWLITQILFEEPGEDEIVGKGEVELTLMEKVETVKIHLQSMSSIVLGGCLLLKCIGSFGSTTILTLAAPFITATYNTDQYSTFLSIFQIIAGLSSILTVVLFMATGLSKRLDPSTTEALALFTFLVQYAASYPWLDAYSTPVVLKDATHPLGCDTTQYSWCAGTRIVDPWTWVALTGALIGIAVPLANIGFDTIYSRELGNIDQNIMQAMLVVFVDLVIGLVPVIATTCFKLYGPNKWWLGVVAVMAGGLVVLLFLKPRLNKTEDEKKKPIQQVEMVKQ